MSSLLPSMDIPQLVYPYEPVDVFSGFPVQVIINKAAMNICVQITSFFSAHMLSFLLGQSRSGIARSYSKCMINVSRKHKHAFTRWVVPSHIPAVVSEKLCCRTPLPTLGMAGEF